MAGIVLQEREAGKGAYAAELALESGMPSIAAGLPSGRGGTEPPATLACDGGSRTRTPCGTGS
jgi:hypothetical protein